MMEDSGVCFVTDDSVGCQSLGTFGITVLELHTAGDVTSIDREIETKRQTEREKERERERERHREREVIVT